MRSTLLLAALLVAAASSPASAQAPVAPYQRLRAGAETWSARGGPGQHWRGGGYGGSHGIGYGGFYAPYFAPPLITGSWYERPYPYHFDYYRHRWGGAPTGPYGDPGVEMIPAADCPCLSPPPVEVVE
jgi:opacity protein-like surface antigen